MAKQAVSSTTSYLSKLYEYLNANYPGKRGLWNYSSANTLESGWLLDSPFDAFGVPYAEFKQAVPGDYPLFNLSAKEAGGPTQQSVPVQATVTKPGDSPDRLLEGHSYRLYDEMYAVMTSARIFLDITTLTPPTDRFLAALTNALAYLSNKPEDQRPVVRILYSNSVANIAGFPDLLLDAAAFLKKVLQKVDPTKKLSVYAGAINAGPEKGLFAWATSWNHSKIVAADGQTAIVGGHNMWGEHYLGKNPVFDVSMKIRGESAAHAQDYADKLWQYVLWRINDSFYDKMQQLMGIPSLVHTAAYRYDDSSGRSAVTLSYETRIVRAPDGHGAMPIMIPNLKGQPDKDLYMHVRGRFSPQSGAVPVLAIGREAGMDLSRIFPDRDSYVNEAGEPADQSIYQLIAMAENKIRMSLQSFSLNSSLTRIEWFIMTWDYKLFYELAKAVRKGVTIEVVLSNPKAVGGGLEWTEAPYDGERIKDVNKRLRDVLIREFYMPQVEAEALIARKFFVTNIRFSPDEMYPDGKGARTVPLPNHAKTFMVDDRIFYIGSQNQYRCNLAEFGFIVEDSATAQSYIDHYWTKLWTQSNRTQDRTYDDSLEEFQNAEATVFILDLMDNRRLDKTWQKAIRDYADAAIDAKEPYLEVLNTIISNAGYQTTADAVIEQTKTPFFTNQRPGGQPTGESDRFVVDLLTKKELLIDFAKLIDSIDEDMTDSDKAVSQFLKTKGYDCTVLQVYASFDSIRGSNLNYFRGEYAGAVVQDGGEAFDFRTRAARRLLSGDQDPPPMQQGPVLLIESDQSVKLRGVALLKPAYSDNQLTWSRADGNATSGAITFSEIPRPGVNDPFYGVECFGEITYPDSGTPPLQGTISFYARKERIKDPGEPDPGEPRVGPPGDWPAIVAILVALGVLFAIGIGLLRCAKKICSCTRDGKNRREGEGQRRDDPNGEGNNEKRARGTDRSNAEDLPRREIEIARDPLAGGLRERNVKEKTNSSNVDNPDGWAHHAVQGTIKKDVDHYVADGSTEIAMDEVGETFEEQFSKLVDDAILEDDFKKETSQTVREILNETFRDLVRKRATAAFRDQIGQSITGSMVTRMGEGDYDKYAAEEMGRCLEASIQSRLSDPLVRRMEIRSASDSLSYIESLLTAEVTARKADYLKNPNNKTALQRDIGKELSEISENQKQTVSEKTAKQNALEQARKNLKRQPSKENEDRVAELNKELNAIVEREKRIDENLRNAEAKRDELDADKLEERRKKSEDEIKRDRERVFDKI